MRGVPASRRPLGDIANVAYRSTALLPAGTAPGIEASFDFAIPEGGWSQATHCCWVEVDPRTGRVAIDRYLVVEDCGALINPTIVEGQIAGGVAQGIGGVLYERAVYDENGQLLTSTLADYLLPTSAEIPPIEIHHLESAPQGALDFRGVGEGGAIGAPAALCNAIADALRPFGAEVLEQHLPPTRILELIGAITAPDPERTGVIRGPHPATRDAERAQSRTPRSRAQARFLRAEPTWAMCTTWASPWRGSPWRIGPLPTRSASLASSSSSRQ